MKIANQTYYPTFNQLSINTDVNRDYGCHQEILNVIQQHLDSMLARHSKLFIIMLTIRCPADYNKSDSYSKIFNTFIEAFIRFERRRYRDVEYIWRIERDTSAHPHWHLVLIYNGNDTQSYHDHLQHANHYWSRCVSDNQGLGLIHVSMPIHGQQGGYKINRGDYRSINDCFCWMSYIAKIGSNFSNKTKNYGYSAL